MAENNTRYARAELDRQRAVWDAQAPEILGCANAMTALEFVNSRSNWFGEIVTAHEKVVHIVRDRGREGAEVMNRISALLADTAKALDEQERLNRSQFRGQSRQGKP